MQFTSDPPEPAQAVQHELAVLPLLVPRGAVRPCQKFRSTWVVSSLEAIRHGGYFERYEALLGPHRDEILSCLAGAWLSLASVHTHYRACDALGMPDAEYAALTRGVGARVRVNWNARIIADAERPDASPWTVLPLLARVWERSADGGAVAVHQVSKSQARVEYVGCTLFDIAYFRRAVRFMILMLISRVQVCQRPSVREAPSTTPGQASYLVHWE